MPDLLHYLHVLGSVQHRRSCLNKHSYDWDDWQNIIRVGPISLKKITNNKIQQNLIPSRSLSPCHVRNGAQRPQDYASSLHSLSPKCVQLVIIWLRSNVAAPPIQFLLSPHRCFVAGVAACPEHTRVAVHHGSV